MIDEDCSLIEDGNEAPESNERDLQRADTAARVRRHRARKELELEGLTLKKLLKLKATRAAELAATKASAERTFSDLTPEQRAIVESDVFKNGAPDWSVVGFKDLRSMMHDVVAFAEVGVTEGIRPDLIFEMYGDFIREYPFAKAMVYPRAWHHDHNKKGEFANSIFGLREHSGNGRGRLVADYQPDDPTEYTLQRFLDSIAKWRNDGTPIPVAADVKPVNRGRGRPKKERPGPPSPTEPLPTTPWSTPPPKPQREHWADVDRIRTHIVLKKDIEDASLTMPIVFPQ